MTVRKVKDRDGGLNADADPGMAPLPVADEDRAHAALVVCNRTGTAEDAAPVLAMLGLVGGDLKPLRLLGTVKP